MKKLSLLLIVLCLFALPGKSEAHGYGYGSYATSFYFATPFIPTVAVPVAVPVVAPVVPAAPVVAAPVVAAPVCASVGVGYGVGSYGVGAVGYGGYVGNVFVRERVFVNRIHHGAAVRVRVRR